MNPSLPKETKALVQIAEMYRIYSAINHSLLKSTPASLVVTSAERGEGKTTVVVGLATMAAIKDKKKVLAIDLNWQDPALHTYFGLDLIEGEKFMNGDSIKDLVQDSGVNNLDVLAAIKSGTDIDETHGNAIAQKLIQQARNVYEVILIDTSKMFPTNRRMMDPVVLSKIADGVALVVLAKVTSRQQAKHAQKVLETTGANILGVIVNQWKNPMEFI
jgi:Mrp family chromosome partitioning ATPase